MQESTIPRGLCQCGCGQRTWIATKTWAKWGWTKGEPVRFVHGHRTSGPDYSVDEATGCWVWLHYIAPHGYGMLVVNGDRHYAHRVYYERFVGPIPEGLVIDHLCRRRSCVNPDHLEVVTAGENVLRGEGGSARNARKLYCPKGHPLFGPNLYRCKNRRQCRICRAEHLARYKARKRGEATG